MKLENQVVNLELSKRLKELGVKQESYFWWNGYVGGGMHHFKLENKRVSVGVEITYSAYTVAELGEMLPEKYGSSKWIWDYGENKGLKHWICDQDFDDEIPYQWSETEADARAKMLIYLLENKLIEVK